jgi:hypothetical protein
MKISKEIATELLRLNQQGFDISQAVYKINTLDEISEKLQKGVCAFVYIKATGEMRYAVGTTNLDLIPTEKRPKNLKTKNSSIKCYFDLQVYEWRSFDKSRLEQII